MADNQEKTEQSVAAEKAATSPGTAEGPDSANASGSGGGSWWGSWIDSAKVKSASVLEAVKKDLDELTTAVKTEATNAGTVLADTFKLTEPESTASNVKKSLSSFFGQVNEVLNPSILEEDDTAEAVLITKEGMVTLTGFAKHLAELQMNDDIYLVEPDLELVPKYKRWMEVVDQDQFTEPRLAKQLASSQILNEKYESLVPGRVSHMQFWQRYLFKRALLEDALANADMAERRARQEATSSDDAVPSRSAAAIVQTEQPKKQVKAPAAVVDPVKEGANAAVDKKANDEDDDDGVDDEYVPEVFKKDWTETVVVDDFSNVELTEEEQAKLLAAYEQEIQERNSKSQPAKGAKGKGATNAGKQQQAAAAQGNAKSGKAAAAAKGPKSNQKGSQGNKGPSNVNNNNNSSSSSSSNNNKAKNEGGKPSAAAKKANAATKDDSDESWEKDFDLDG